MRRIAATSLLVLLCALATAQEAAAHGTTTAPASRSYVCRFLDRTSEPCANAWDVRPQALYDWMGVLISEARGRHRELIPDGQLCSAGNADFRALDRPSASWPASRLDPGRRTFSWYLNAPHATAYYRFYLTKEGWDPAAGVRWDDLELIHDSGPRPAARKESFAVDVPARTGRHVVYSVWQRSDSPEAFYACSDVVFGQDGAVPAQVPDPDEAVQPGEGHGDHGEPVAPSAPSPSPAPAPRPSGGKPTSRGFTLRREVDTDWGGGYCATVTVRNRTGRARAWRGSLPMRDRITGLWNAVHTVRDGRLRVRGRPYNRVVAARGTTTFGFCAERRR